MPTSAGVSKSGGARNRSVPPTIWNKAASEPSTDQVTGSPSASVAVNTATSVMVFSANRNRLPPLTAGGSLVSVTVTDTVPMDPPSCRTTSTTVSRSSSTASTAAAILRLAEPAPAASVSS